MKLTTRVTNSLILGVVSGTRPHQNRSKWLESCTLLYLPGSVPFLPFTKARTKSNKEAYSSGGTILKPLSHKNTKQPLPIKRVEHSNATIQATEGQKEKGLCSLHDCSGFIFPPQVIWKPSVACFQTTTGKSHCPSIQGHQFTRKRLKCS